MKRRFRKNGSPTQRAPDGWESPRFEAGFWLEVGFVKVALSRPAHPRVTHTVSLLAASVNYSFEYQVVKFHRGYQDGRKRSLRTHSGC